MERCNIHSNETGQKYPGWLKPISLELAIKRGIAEIPVDQCDFEAAASMLAESIPFNHYVEVER